MGLNVVVFNGNLTRDPELKTVNAGGKETNVVNFTMAINDYHKKSDGEAGNTTVFIDCEAWDSGARVINDYLKKGDPLLVHGKLRMDQWETDGQKRTKHKIRVERFEFIRGKGGDNAAPAAKQDSAPATADAGVGGDDIPF